METIVLRDEFIKLGQALKAAGLCDTGAQAKTVIQEGLVSVNGQWKLREERSCTPEMRFHLRDRLLKLWISHEN